MIAVGQEQITLGDDEVFLEGAKDGLDDAGVGDVGLEEFADRAADVRKWDRIYRINKIFGIGSIHLVNLVNPVYFTAVCCVAAFEDFLCAGEQALMAAVQFGEELAAAFETAAIFLRGGVLIDQRRTMLRNRREAIARLLQLFGLVLDQIEHLVPPGRKLLLPGHRLGQFTGDRRVAFVQPGLLVGKRFMLEIEALNLVVELARAAEQVDDAGLFVL